MARKIPTTKPNGLLLALIAGCVAVSVPYISMYLRYRAFDLDPREPRYFALMNLAFFIVLVLPIIFLILSIIRGKCMRPLFRVLVVVSPALLLTMPGFIEAVMVPEKPGVPFSERMAHPIPEDATGFRAWFSHSPGESSYMFTFRCSAASTETLLAANSYKLIENPAMLDPDIGEYFQVPIGGMTLPKGWPKPKSWNGLKVFSSEVPGGYRYLLTNADQSRVFILAGDT